MSVSAGRTRLVAVTRELAAKWAQTKEYWQDSKCQEFDRKYILELMASVERATIIIEQLDKLVMKVRSDCE